MSKRKHSEAEMIGALKQLEAGRTAADVGRELGVSKHTTYAWKAKYGGLEVSEAVLEAAVAQVRQEYAFSERRACGLMTVAVSSYRYQSLHGDEGLRLRLLKLARKKPRFGVAYALL